MFVSEQPTQPVVEEMTDDKAPKDSVRPSLRLSQRKRITRCASAA